jgi:hypothetical protein
LHHVFTAKNADAKMASERPSPFICLSSSFLDRAAVVL